MWHRLLLISILFLVGLAIFNLVCVFVSFFIFVSGFDSSWSFALFLFLLSASTGTLRFVFAALACWKGFLISGSVFVCQHHEFLLWCDVTCCRVCFYWCFVDNHCNKSHISLMLWRLFDRHRVRSSHPHCFWCKSWRYCCKRFDFVLVLSFFLCLLFIYLWFCCSPSFLSLLFMHLHFRSLGRSRVSQLLNWMTSILSASASFTSLAPCWMHCEVCSDSLRSTFLAPFLRLSLRRLLLRMLSSSKTILASRCRHARSTMSRLRPARSMTEMSLRLCD